jgi:hypothetical protein
MAKASLQTLGGVSLIGGSLLLTLYSTAFPLLIPMTEMKSDFVRVVLSPHWVPLAGIGLIGVLFMIAGFGAVYSKLRTNTGVIGAIGFLSLEAAYFLQACKLTWELFLYPIIAAHPESAFLLRNAVIVGDTSVRAFMATSAITIFVGIALFCFTLYRSRSFPKVAAVLIFTGALLFGLGQIISLFAMIAGILILASGCFVLGIKLIREHDVTI